MGQCQPAAHTHQQQRSYFSSHSGAGSELPACPHPLPFAAPRLPACAGRTMACSARWMRAPARAWAWACRGSRATTTAQTCTASTSPATPRWSCGSRRTAAARACSRARPRECRGTQGRAAALAAARANPPPEARSAPPHAARPCAQHAHPRTPHCPPTVRSYDAATLREAIGSAYPQIPQPWVEGIVAQTCDASGQPPSPFGKLLSVAQVRCCCACSHGRILCMRVCTPCVHWQAGLCSIWPWA